MTDTSNPVSFPTYWFHERRTVAAIIVITMGSVGAAWATGRPDWLTLGGGILTLIGIPLTAWRLLRLGVFNALKDQHSRWRCRADNATRLRSKRMLRRSGQARKRLTATSTPQLPESHDEH